MRKQERGLKLVKPAAVYPARRKIKKMLIRLFLLLAVMLLLYAGQALFKVRKIQLSGAVRLEEGEVLAEAGLRKGMSIFLVRERKASERLTALPVISSAVVSRRFPSTVQIKLVERVPAAYLLDRECFWAVDREGIVIERRLLIGESLPIVTGAVGGPFAPGFPPARPDQGQALALFLCALESVPELEIAELNLGDVHNLVLYTIDGQEVLLGGSEKMEQKLTLVWQSLPYLVSGGGSAGCFDVRTGDRLVVLSDRSHRAREGVSP